MNKFSNSILKSIFQTNILPVRFKKGFTIKDVGIKKRARILDLPEQLDPELEEMDIEDLEADFHQVEKSHKQHLREMKAFKEQEKFHIVRQKYFKEKWPNYLTWADKQQIKYLHSTNPKEWSVDKLSEGFPALPETIHKVLKSDWTPKNADRVKRHDAAVQQNWMEFKNGKDNHLPSDLQSHLSKFTSRELNLNPNLTDFEVEDVTKQLVKKGGEFSQIIQSYESLKLKSKTNQSSQKCLPESELQTKNLNLQWNFDEVNETPAKKQGNDVKASKKKQKLLTHEELQKDLVDNQNEDFDEELEDDNTSKQIILKPDEINVNIEKFQSAESQVNLYKPKRDYANLTYPERINIPADKLRKGYTYKLNDCYYDFDGEFLYRVPGMQ